MDILINEVSKSFKDKMVLRNFSTTLHENKVTCIMGPSGCGKTTLLNILMGIISVDSGTITGVPGKKSAIFQEDRLCESFSALVNVSMVCQRDVSTKMIEEHLWSIGIGDSMHKPVSELSGGMRRRVAIVRAILRNADIYFFDEPFKGLDSATKDVAMQYMKSHIGGKTIIMVSHDEQEAVQMSDDILRMPISSPILFKLDNNS